MMDGSCNMEITASYCFQARGSSDDLHIALASSLQDVESRPRVSSPSRSGSARQLLEKSMTSRNLRSSVRRAVAAVLLRGYAISMSVLGSHVRHVRE